MKYAEYKGKPALWIHSFIQHTFSATRALLNDEGETALNMAYHHWQVGLDIQNGCLRALAVERRRHGWQLRQWWQIPLSADILREGSSQHSDALCDVLMQWWRVLPRRISLRVGFPAQRILQQLMTAPDSRLREPERDWYIDYQAARLFTIGRESLVLDYRREPPSPGALLITAAKREEMAQW